MHLSGAMPGTSVKPALYDDKNRPGYGHHTRQENQDKNRQKYLVLDEFVAILG